jgi:hypothetical protein
MDSGGQVRFGELTQLREDHQPRRHRWWQRSTGPQRCRGCGLSWPCPPNRWARARILELLREALTGAASGEVGC